jgi:predicted permease
MKSPRFARWIIERALPPDVREDVIGDQDEMFRRASARRGPLRACLWYWGQTLSFSRHFISERLRERRREAHMWIGFSWIDFRLALRMLVRYPGLTLVSVAGIAVGITIAAGASTIAYNLMDPTLPLEEGERVVSIVTLDVRTSNTERRTLSDFSRWRTLRSIEDIGAVRTASRNLIVDGGHPEPIVVAEMQASGFRLARVSPALGRALVPDDERPGAPDVLVIGYDVWTRRFESDPAVLGREVQLGNVRHTIVGVMPAGFGFPESESYWIPFRLDPTLYEPRTGPAINVFARLAPGATLETAQAELATVAGAIAAASPGTHADLRPRVVPYTYAYTDMSDPNTALALRAIQTAIVLVLVLICVNVAILVYARTATRLGEIAVRTALGASRQRIVVQLFLEALALSAAAAVVGIALLSAGLAQLDAALRQIGTGRMPFWMSLRMSTLGVAYTLALTVLAAVIVGVLPALKATGRRVQAGLQRLSPGSGASMQMGRLWTALIVAQVAVTVAVLPATVFQAWSALRFRMGNPGYAAEEFLSTQLAMDRTLLGPATPVVEREFRQRFGHRTTEFERRLEADPAVAGVTFSLAEPGGELAAVIEIDGMAIPGDPVDYNIVEGSRNGHFVRFNRVAIDYFDLFEVPLVMGRNFEPADAAVSANHVLVDRRFAERMFGGVSPLGRRLRYVGRSREAGEGNVALGTWFEIVGVVSDFPPHANAVAEPRVYHAADAASVYPASMALRIRGQAPSAFAGRLREIGAAVDPELQLRGISSAEEVRTREQDLMRLTGVTLVAVILSVVMLSAAGIYALMSFTVARRRKEIGIRAALGADPVRLLAGIFSRAARQLALGVLFGLLGAVGLEQLLEAERVQGQGAVILALVAVFMTGVGLVATIVPARQGLRIQPTEALREE